MAMSRGSWQAFNHHTASPLSFILVNRVLVLQYWHWDCCLGTVGLRHMALVSCQMMPTSLQSSLASEWSVC
jgi:hypothetical protein